MIEQLPWDSEHFGVPIGRVAGGRLTRDDVETADRSGLRCLYLLIPADESSAIADAEDLGFRVVSLRLTMSRPVQPGDPPAASVRPARPEDLPVLEPVAATAHSDTRFFVDPGFGRDAARHLYERWLRASVLEGFADLALVAEHEGRPVGYITGHFHSATRSVAIGLLAVGDLARGRGLGVQLVNALLRAAEARGFERVDVVTQGRNLRAQRLYARAGFHPTRREVWLHRWSAQPVTNTLGCDTHQVVAS